MKYVVFAYAQSSAINNIANVAKNYDSFRRTRDVFGNAYEGFKGIDFIFSTRRAARSFRNILRNRRKGLKISSLYVFDTPQDNYAEIR